MDKRAKAARSATKQSSKKQHKANKGAVAKATKEPKLVKLTKIKQWYMPADTLSYKRLRKAGVPLLRFHEDMLSVVAMIAKRKNIHAELVSFKETILHPFMDRISDEWRKLHEDTAVKIDSKAIRLSTTHSDASESVEPVIEDLRQCIARFFERWGFNFDFEASVKRGKHLIHIDYWFADSKLPVIHLEDDPAEQQTFELELGFLKLSFTTDDKYLNTTVHVSQGGIWSVFYTSRCLYSQVANVNDMLQGLFDLSQRDPDIATRAIKPNA